MRWCMWRALRTSPARVHLVWRRNTPALWSRKRRSPYRRTTQRKSQSCMWRSARKWKSAISYSATIRTTCKCSLKRRSYSWKALKTAFLRWTSRLIPCRRKRTKRLPTNSFPIPCKFSLRSLKWNRRNTISLRRRKRSRTSRNRLKIRMSWQKWPALWSRSMTVPIPTQAAAILRTRILRFSRRVLTV